MASTTTDPSSQTTTALSEEVIDLKQLDKLNLSATGTTPSSPPTPHPSASENGLSTPTPPSPPKPTPSPTTPLKPPPTDTPKTSISYYQLYRHADRFSWFLMFIGSLAAAAAGITRPIMTIIFANLVDAFTSATKGDMEGGHGGDQFKRVLIEHVVYFVYLGVGTFVTNYLQMLCFDLSSTRQTTQIRTLYLSSILHQSRSFFDTHNSGELASRLTADIELIQNGTGEKVGMFLQAMCTFVAALGVAFWQSWRVTLVLSTLFPIMFVCNVYFNAKARTAGVESLKAYGLASNIVEESLSSIRTVLALRGQERIAAQFGERVQKAEDLSVLKSRMQGAALAGVQSFMYLAYSIAFFYGSYLITLGVLTSGRLTGVFFALMIGTFRLSTVAPELAAFGNACSAAHAVFSIIDKEPEVAKPREGGM
ncbi:hypothetical protein HK097_000507, partial [Rhizophlyctis rosea]